MSPRAAPAADEVREMPARAGPFPFLALRSWQGAFPGLVAGVTAAGPGADFGLHGSAPAGVLLERCETVSAALGFDAVTLCRQVHGNRVVAVEAVSAGFHSPGIADGMATSQSGVLLGVTVADCVPVFVVDPQSRTAALLHAGWRGVASGILETAAWLLASRFSVPPDRLHLHLGPAICGTCYEVGGEVLGAFGLPQGGPGRLDLRERLVARGRSLGVPPERITRSAWCTRCDSPRLHSHRAGSPARMLAVLGWEAGP